MHVEVKDSFESNEEGLPARIDFTISFGTDSADIPLQRVLGALARHLASGATGHPAEVTLAATIPGTQRHEADEPSVARPVARLIGSEWRRPQDVHGKALKTVHRVVAELDKAGRKGLTVQEIQDRTGLSLAPLYNLLKADQPQGRYASKYISATKVGRSQVLDLSTDGRYLASLIRADKVPA